MDRLLHTLKSRVLANEDDAVNWHRGVCAVSIFRERPDMPLPLKMASVMKRYFETVPIMVLPEDVILGVQKRRERIHEGVSDGEFWRIICEHPEYRWRNWDNACGLIPEDVYSELSYFNGRTLRPACGFENERRYYLKSGFFSSLTAMANGHTLPDYGILLENGIRTLRLDIDMRRTGLADGDERTVEYDAMRMYLDALAAFALRLADAAVETASRLDDEILRSRLMGSAAVCRNIAVERPATLHEALQLIYIGHSVDHIEAVGDAASYGRIDQLLNPFYLNDIGKGTLTPDSAQELISYFYLKGYCVQDSCNMTIGGYSPAGTDGANDLTYMFLHAMNDTGLARDISVRCTRSTPGDIWSLVSEVLAKNLGRPNVLNDEIVVPGLAAHGIDIADARDYAIIGCSEIMIPGRGTGRMMCLGMRPLKFLELALNKGSHLIGGKREFDGVPDVYTSFDDLIGEIHARMEMHIGRAVDIMNDSETNEYKYMPRPWLTVLSRGGIETGVDVTRGQPRYDLVGVRMNYLADYIDSLYAVKHLVYESNEIDLDDLRVALGRNWEGSEALRMKIMNRLPKFGHGNETVDALARDETDFFAACFEGKLTAFGGRFMPMIFGVEEAMHVHGRADTGASANGRKHGDEIANTLNPSSIAPRGELPGLLTSMASIDGMKYPGGISNVQEFDPLLIAGEGGSERLVHILKGWFMAGGMGIGVNIIREKDLLAAKDNPKEWEHLMVRVFGLSARFVALSPAIQDKIIRRVQHASVQHSALQPA